MLSIRAKNFSRQTWNQTFCKQCNKLPSVVIRVKQTSTSSLLKLSSFGTSESLFNPRTYFIASCASFMVDGSFIKGAVSDRLLRYLNNKNKNVLLKVLLDRNMNEWSVRNERSQKIFGCKRKVVTSTQIIKREKRSSSRMGVNLFSTCDASAANTSHWLTEEND